MQWSDLITALALLMIIEGALPFINPSFYRSILLMALRKNSMVLRGVGITSMLAGLVILSLVR
ncbi:MAG: DUF2065 domain-containing protein [Candidatus Oxydemutatoraceae bacterium WSBS_2016_MAG_OTU14]